MWVEAGGGFVLGSAVAAGGVAVFGCEVGQGDGEATESAVLGGLVSGLSEEQ